MAPATTLAGIAGTLAVGLLFMAWMYTLRIRDTPAETELARADIAESEKVRRQSLYGALGLGVFAVIMVIAALV